MMVLEIGGAGAFGAHVVLHHDVEGRDARLAGLRARGQGGGGEGGGRRLQQPSPQGL